MRAVLHAGFVVTGAATTLLGPILPLLMNRWSLNDADAGFFFTLQFCGNLLGIASLGVLLVRRGYRFTLSLGFGLMSVGVAGLLAAGPFEARIATLLLGSGLGLTISGVNLWVGEDTSETSRHRASALSLLNMTWGLGAVAFPLLVLRAQSAGRLFALLLSAAVLCAVPALFLAVRGSEPRAEAARVESSAPERASAHTSTSIILGALFFLYVGAEASVAGWAATLASRIPGAASRSGDWTLAPMFFWAGLLSGRALVPVALRAISERALLLGGMTLAAAATGALLAVSTFEGVAFSVSAAGLGMAATYPLLAAWMFRQFGVRTRHRANVLFALGCAGGAVLPWLVGFTSSRTGNLRAGLSVPLAGCLLVLGLLACVRRASPAGQTE
jgi:MFS transporter, FHS family, glucose/mannose:H+ symporter